MKLGSRPRLVVAIAVVVIGSVVGPTVLANLEGYEISVEGSIDVPDRTIDPDEVPGNYTISAIGIVEPGKDIRVTVDGPAGEVYDIQLRGEDQQIKKAEYVQEGQTEAAFTTGDLPPGVYFVVVDPESSDEWAGIHPIVVEGYEVKGAWGALPESTEAGSEITVAASMGQRSESDQLLAEDTPADVVIKEVSGEAYQRISLSPSDGDYSRTTFSFTKTITLDVSPGEYNVYVAARGTGTINGENAPVGVNSSAGTIRVTGPSTPTPAPTPTPTSTPTPTDTPTPTPSPTTLPPTEPPTATTLPPTDPDTPTEPPDTPMEPRDTPTEPPDTPTEPPTTEPPTTEPPTEPRDTLTGPPDTPTEPPDTPTDVVVTPPPIDTAEETPTLARPSTDTPTDDVVITPGSGTDGTDGTDDPTVTGGQPGFTLLGTIVVILFLVGAWLRRS